MCVGGDRSIEGAVNPQPLRSVCVSECDSEYECVCVCVCMSVYV